MNKVIRDGKVAVLVSMGHGAGWYTWNQGITEMLFDPTVVDMVLNGMSNEEIVAYAQFKFPGAYLGGVDTLAVRWVPEGEKFRVEEYDGAESLVLQSRQKWITA